MANRQYTNSQRTDAVDQILTQGRPASQVARDMSISVTTVHRWVSDALTARATPAPAPEERPRTLPGPASSSPRHSVQLQLDDALHRLGQLEMQLEQLLAHASVGTAS